MDRSRHWGDQRTFMSEALMKATSYFHVILQGNRTFGWYDRSIGSPVIRNQERYWLRVVSENKKWIQKDWWEGNFVANEIKGIPKPNVIDFYEWEDGNIQLRAELMSFVEGQIYSPTQELRFYIDLPEIWWLEFRNSLSVLSSWKTERMILNQDDISHQFLVFYGDDIDSRVRNWTTVIEIYIGLMY